MNQALKRLLYLVVAGVVVVAVTLIAIQWNQNRHHGATATSTTNADAWHLSSCGPVRLDHISVTNPKTRRVVSIQAAVFYPFGCVRQRSGCSYGGTSHAFPDAGCTPGAIYDLSGVYGRPNTNPARFDAALAKQVVCASTTSGRRSVSEATKAAVFREYGIVNHVTGQYEVDHVISLELDGANAIGNLAPELNQPTLGFHQKDVAENNLAKALCHGGKSLAEVDTAIVQSWPEYAK